MKWNKSYWFIFGVLILMASLYRVWDGRPWGFVPQIAMAIFAGAVIKDKRWAFVLPLLSLFLSDVLYQLLYINGLTEIPGFYSGQLLNYVLFGALTVFGFFIRKLNWLGILATAVAAPVAYFLLSNCAVWLGGGGYNRPNTWDGLLMTYADGLPFFRGSLIGTLFFSVLLFGGYFLIRRNQAASKQLAS